MVHLQPQVLLNMKIILTYGSTNTRFYNQYTVLPIHSSTNTQFYQYTVLPIHSSTNTQFYQYTVHLTVSPHETVSLFTVLPLYLTSRSHLTIAVFPDCITSLYHLTVSPHPPHSVPNFCCLRCIQCNQMYT